MELGAIGTTLRGYETYARAATVERIEAAAAAQSASTSSRMGLSIGRLGVQYETEDASTEDALSSARSAMLSARAMAASSGRGADAVNAEAASSLSLGEGADASGSVARSDQAGIDDLSSQTSPFDWLHRAGVQAYQRSEAAYRADGSVGAMLRAAV